MGRKDGGGEADEEHPDTPVVSAQAYTQKLRCGLRLRGSKEEGGGQGMSRDTPLTPEDRERGDAAYKCAQAALAVEDACTPRGLTAEGCRMVESTTCEECGETDSVAEGVNTPMPPERHSGCTRDREGEERVKRGSNTLWQATCHQEVVPRYIHLIPVATTQTALSNDKGRLYERGNWVVSRKTRQAVANMTVANDTAKTGEGIGNVTP